VFGLPSTRGVDRFDTLPLAPEPQLHPARIRALSALEVRAVATAHYKVTGKGLFTGCVMASGAIENPIMAL
jgi:hypothetical protein